MSDSRASSVMFWFRCVLAAILSFGAALLILTLAGLALVLIVGYEHGELVEFIERTGDTWPDLVLLMIMAITATAAAWWATRGRRPAVLGGLVVGLLIGLYRLVLILRTTDGGENWVDQSSGTSWDLFCVFSTDANTGTVVGEFGTILRTTDGGGGP